ncbi:hypothetical protein M5K25_017735 [Dendrobium thyrsiflorum]|uniref:Nodulin-like domain-containing protein n=1 Tax=Dendrobium thyrsiflorum TaxID=117978 RepID=A0ABD0UN24_DENTH
MAGQSRRWMILLATVWIQAFTGTNFDFSSYSSELKAAMGISQVQLNYLAVASDLGKAFGWSSGLALLYLPLPAVLFLAAALGFVAYGVQWLLITSRIALPYAPVFMLCLLAGLSICWFNTVCFVLCIQNFSTNRCVALSLTVSFNGVSAALYTLVAKAINGSPSSYLLLNAVLPVLTSLTALIPILRQPPLSSSSRRRDTHIFLLLNFIAFLTGLYLLLLNPAAPNPATSRLLLAGALILLALPLAIPGIVVAREWALRTIYSSQLEDSEEYHDIRKELIPGDGELENQLFLENNPDNNERGSLCCCSELIAKDRLVLLGEEHGASRLIRRFDFWIYYISYLCGGTLGLVYSNNLGQIAQSLGRQSHTSMLVNVYSSCSFFGRLISAAPDMLLGGRVSFARTGWLAAALVPMPLAFFLLAADAENGHVLVAGTALVGLSSGFVFAGAVSVTSELFGPASFGVNHNIVITNIPFGSQLYGLLAALVYDANGRVLGSWHMREAVAAMVVCMGRRCYSKTFFTWGVISIIGLAFAVLLYLRTRPAYNHAAGCAAPRRGLRSDCEDFR